MSLGVRWFENAPVAQVDRARAEALRHPHVRAWWQATERGDWMLWTAGAAGVDSRLLVAAAVDCARLVLGLLDDDARAIARDALARAEQWCEGRVGPGDCRQAAQAVYREAERTVPIDDPRVAACRTVALGAVEVAVQAAAWSDDRGRCGEFVAECARRVANAFGRMHGPEEAEATHARCAAIVRARIQATLLPLP